MIRSMTAFGRASVKGEERVITVEVKSVNSRFFDCTVRLPRAYSFMEEKVKGRVQSTVARAKVEVSISVENRGTSGMRVEVDMPLAAAYIDALRRLRDEFSLADDISVMTVARQNDLFTYTREEEDPEEAWARVCEVLDMALADYAAMREAEGQKTEADIRAKLARVGELAEQVAAISREDTVGYRAKLEARIRAILADESIVPDEGRLLTECAVFADKIAIDEELVRLSSHFTAFDEICRASEPSGRKLDFLMQELNRETNTIGSKANNARIARLVVEMKGELEKIREQVQNIE